MSIQKNAAPNGLAHNLPVHESNCVQLENWEQLLWCRIAGYCVNC